MKTKLKNLHLTESYGQNKIRSQISFVFCHHFCQKKLALQEQAPPMSPEVLAHPYNLKSAEPGGPDQLVNQFKI